MIDERARSVAEPEPGFFAMPLVRGGPLMPARIYRPCPIEMSGAWQWLDRWPPLVAEIAGKECSVDQVWLYAARCTPREFEYLSFRLRLAQQQRPDLPEARPRERVDWRKAPRIFQPRSSR